MTGIDYEQRGAGDEFNFKLSMGTGRIGRTGSSPNTNNENSPSGNTANAGLVANRYLEGRGFCASEDRYF